MKKLLILTMIAVSLLTACGNKKETQNTDTAPQTTQAAATTNHKVDFDKVVSDESVDEIISYLTTNDPSLKEEDVRADISDMINIIKAVNKLDIDISESYEQILASMGGDESIKSALDSGISQSYIDFVLASQSSTLPLYDYMKENNLLIDGKDYFLENYWRAKHVLVKTEGMDDAQKAEAKKKAEDILARAKAGEDFAKMVAELSEDPGSQSQPDGYVFTTGAMVPEFEEGTKNTPIGEFTLVETTYGYHVIQRLAIDETPELYAKFYEENNIELIANEQTLIDFANKTANE